MAFLKDLIEKPLTGEWGNDGGEVNVIRTTNFTNFGILDFSNVVKRNISEKKIEQKKLLKGDIIIEKSGGSPKQPVGRVVFFQEEGTYLCNNFTSILRPKKDKVEPKYLHYLLYGSHRFGITGMFQNKTTGIINLQLPRYVDKLEIPLPPLKIQKQIASILDNAAALRDKTKQLLKEYDLLAQSIFLEMFGDPVLNPKKWIIKKLAELCEKITDGTHKTPKYLNDGVVFLSAKNIKNYELNSLNPKYISLDEHNALSKRCPVGREDILITKSGSLGMAAMVDFDFEFSIFESLALIKYHRNLVNGKYLLYFLNTPSTQFQYNRITKGVGVKHLHLKDLRALNVIEPPINLQNQFAEKIVLIEQQKALAKQELQESEDLFNCLLQKAFKGELV